MTSESEDIRSCDNQAAAEHALAALRRSRLVRSWTATEPASYDVLVGRGTVEVDTLDAIGVLALAVTLRRDRVVQAAPARPLGSRTTRYPLSDGRVLDHHVSRVDRYDDEYPFSVYVPGADKAGAAALDFAAKTKTEALALAGLARVRGRCTRCERFRPLAWRYDSWLPDPTIPCPGCGAGSTTEAALSCAACKQPIVPNPFPGPVQFPCAWLHVHSGMSYCDCDDPDSAWARADRRAHFR